MTVAIASTGRPAILAATIGHLARLRDRPDRLVVCVARPGDLDTARLPAPPFPLQVLTGPRGTCAQRNAALREGDPEGLVLFLDDDFLIADGYLDGLRRLFAAEPEVVMATGRLVADGIHGPGLSVEEGLALLARAGAPAKAPAARDIYSAYGCNMAVRAAALLDGGEGFDEGLPLYGWLEDLDLSRRLAARGRVVRDDSLVGVHLGTKVGRTRGLLLGYSQVANPVYLVRKGTMDARRAGLLMTRNLLANAGKSLWPEPAIDRRGRLRGNLRALLDLARGRLSPRRILDL